MIQLNKDSLQRYFIIFLAFIILGIFGAQFTDGIKTQTERGCPCIQSDGEVDCNNITEEKYLFYTGLFNVVQERRGSQVIVCSEGKQVDSYTEFDSKKYTIVKILDIPIISV